MFRRHQELNHDVSAYGQSVSQILRAYISTGSREGSFGIDTRYGLECPVIESGGGQIFRTYQDQIRGPPSLLYNGYLVFPGVKAAGAWC
jgi:hypothetical protein